MPAALEDSELLRAEPGQALPVDWNSIKLVMCQTAMTFQEAEAKFKVSHWAIRKRAEREEWPLPDVIAKRAAEIRAERDASKGVQKVDIIEATAQDWAEKGISHRGLAFRIAHEAMKTAPVPEIKDWADMERADKMARRASGLDSDEGKGGNSLTLNLIQQRMDIPTAVSGEYIQAEVQEIPQETQEPE